MLIFVGIILAVVLAYIFGKSYFEKKSFENKLDKNRVERCVSREKEKCNSKRKRCKLYDRKGNEECQNEFDECIQASSLKCGR